LAVLHLGSKKAWDKKEMLALGKNINTINRLI